MRRSCSDWPPTANQLDRVFGSDRVARRKQRAHVEGAPGAYGTRIRMQALFGVLSCLPTVPGLPLWGTGTSVRRRFCWAALGQAGACQCSLMWVVGRKESGSPLA